MIVRDKISKKMIVTDLDGTLLRNDKSISEYTFKIIKKLCDEGHKFVIATARPFRATKKLLENVKIDAGIYHNGALIFINGEKTEDYQIDNANQIIEKILLEYPNASIAIESEDVLYSNFDAKRLWSGVNYIHTKTNFSELIGKKSDKIIIEVSSLEDMKKYEEFLPVDLYIQLSENKIGMIMKKDATKSNGVDSIAKKFDVELKNIIAFGDDYNDIDMLKFCGIGVCVKNAVEDVKNVADYICDSNENDGVAKWIEKFIL
jgi:hypothetical protein